VCKGAARSKVLRGLDTALCPAVFGRDEASCRQDVGNAATDKEAPERPQWRDIDRAAEEVAAASHSSAR